MPYQTIVALVVLTCCALPASAAPGMEITPYLGVNYFTWREYNAGRKLLKENGPLFSGGAVFGIPFRPSATNSLALRAKQEVFGGYIDYDGETQGANPVPVKTEVSYVGTRHDVDLGFRHSEDSWDLEPFAGLGYRWWFRGLQDARTAQGAAVSGYTEYWQTGYLRLGARGSFRDDTGITLLAEAGAKYPFYTGNSVKFAGYGTTTFRPEGRWSGFAEAGLRYHHFKATLAFESFRFGASPTIPVGGKLLFQPDSSSELLGLNLGWSF